jgi:hypothetical protein
VFTLRKRRSDGVAADDVPNYRRVMPYIMRSRNGSAVYFEQQAEVMKTLRFLDGFDEPRPTLLHVLAWASVQTLARFPRMNRFVAGGRLYDRNGIWISYSAKTSVEQGSPLRVVKSRFDPQESFVQLVKRMQAELAGTRASSRTGTERELELLLRAQGLPLRALMAVERVVDAFGLLPRAFIDNDPMFASLFIANLGSLGMDAAYHHLYEYGTVSVFCAMGRVTNAPVVQDDDVTVRPVLPLRFTFDERVEDGMYAHVALEHLRAMIEDPEPSIG